MGYEIVKGDRGGGVQTQNLFGHFLSRIECRMMRGDPFYPYLVSDRSALYSQPALLVRPGCGRAAHVDYATVPQFREVRDSSVDTVRIVDQYAWKSGSITIDKNHGQAKRQFVNRLVRHSRRSEHKDSHLHCQV